MDPNLHQILKHYGSLPVPLWKMAEHVAQMNGTKYEKWPDWCFIPFYLMYLMFNGNTPSEKYGLYRHAKTITGLATWRTTQGIYQFDRDIFESVWQTPIHGEIPADIITHLPEWCVYIPIPTSSLPVSASEFYGFWAYLSYNINDAPSLCLIPNVSNTQLETIDILLKGTLDSAITNMTKELKMVRSADWFDHLDLPDRSEQSQMTLEELRQFLEPLISLVLYVASQASEIQDLRGQRTPQNPAPKKTKGQYRYFPPDKLTTWTVGYRLGAALRKAFQEEEKYHSNQGLSKSRARPHIRRAHWHTYWTGSKAQGQAPVLKWLPPIPVNLELGELVPTIRPIQAI